MVLAKLNLDLTFVDQWTVVSDMYSVCSVLPLCSYASGERFKVKGLGEEFYVMSSLWWCY